MIIDSSGDNDMCAPPITSAVDSASPLMLTFIVRAPGAFGQRKKID